MAAEEVQPEMFERWEEGFQAPFLVFGVEGKPMAAALVLCLLGGLIVHTVQAAIIFGLIFSMVYFVLRQMAVYDPRLMSVLLASRRYSRTTMRARSHSSLRPYPIRKRK